MLAQGTDFIAVRGASVAAFGIFDIGEW